MNISNPSRSRTTDVAQPLNLPASIEAALQLADVSWHAILRDALQALQVAAPEYLPELAQDSYLPTEGRLFAAFSRPLATTRYILVGEGPYPRAASATGVCFMDGAVGSLWSDEVGGGLSKAVNRATSLRNWMKMLMVASGKLPADGVTPARIAAIAAQAHAPDSPITQSLPQFQAKLEQQGFLLVNASLVFRPHVAPVKEAKPWQVFFLHVLASMQQEMRAQGLALPTLVLWGKIAAQLQQFAVLEQFPQICAEHPYNLSFIHNQEMQAFFAPMDLLGLTTA
ncbi:MAG: uracil-DNA glycosylase [Burkholderiales bacterium]|nr:uracil-DNA glycosylase [Burkholderiales bacterium]